MINIYNTIDPRDFTFLMFHRYNYLFLVISLCNFSPNHRVGASYTISAESAGSHKFLDCLTGIELLGISRRDFK